MRGCYVFAVPKHHKTHVFCELISVRPCKDVWFRTMSEALFHNGCLRGVATQTCHTVIDFQSESALDKPINAIWTMHVLQESAYQDYFHVGKPSRNVRSRGVAFK